MEEQQETRKILSAKKLLSPIKSSVLIQARPRAQPARLRVLSNERVVNALIRLRNSGLSEWTQKHPYKESKKVARVCNLGS